ncbi:hypothetical protein BKA56DRAFT_589625 [Ilyonectria sp. MPI-CAGE-AT-0026]|nr:hypothetical protein BKA56DRAFT_589625 [Ilyonectria sp. MPI-CAGE-AT-0026]
MNTTLKQGEIGLKRFDENTLEHKPTDYLQATEDKLYADMNLEDCIEGKQYHDVVGGYQRLDVFEVKVDKSR